MYLTAILCLSVVSVAVASEATPVPAQETAEREVRRVLAEAQRLDDADPSGAVALLKQSLGAVASEEPLRVDLLAAIARVNKDRLRDPLGALPWFEAAWEEAIRVRNDDAFSIGESLATIYEDSGRLLEAEAVVRRHRTLATEADDQVRATARLVRLITEQRPQDPELAALETQLSALERQLLADTESPVWERAGALERQADRKLETGQPSEAVPLLEQAIELLERESGNPIYPQRKLIEVLIAEGQLPRALEVAESALSMQEQRLGHSHPELHWSLGAVADLLSRLGRSDDAVATLDRAQALAARTHGPRSSRAEQVSEARARLEDRRSRAVPLDEKTLFACTCSCDTTTDPIRERLAAGDYEGARELARSLVRDTEAEHGEGSLEAAATLGRVATPFDQIDPHFAVAQRERQWHILATRRGLDHPDVTDLSRRLGWETFAANRHEDSRRYREAAVAGWEASGLETSTEWVGALNALAQVQKAQGDFRAAFETWSRAAALARTSYGEDAPEYRWALRDLADSLSQQNRPDDALEILEAIVTACEGRTKGSCPHDKAAALFRQAGILKQLGRTEEANARQAQAAAVHRP